mgnify:FL=1
MKFRKGTGTSIVGPLVAVVVVTIVVGLTTGRFFSPNNITNIMLQVRIVSLISIGSTFVIVS